MIDAWRQGAESAAAECERTGIREYARRARNTAEFIGWCVVFATLMLAGRLEQRVRQLSGRPYYPKGTPR